MLRKAVSPRVFARVFMQKGLKLNGQMRALAIALGGAVVTSVIAMLVPTGIWEAITGSTGISELIPATAAPLGDTARAMIAFAFGALAFAVLAALLLRRPVAAPFTRSAEMAPVANTVVEDDTSFVAKMRGRLNDFVESRRAGPVVTELSDLPKLRAGDAHPDAPPRRPISAHTDFAELTPPPPIAAVEEDVVAASPATVDPLTVASMVDRLETAVAEREERLAKLEALARTEIAKPVVAVVEPAEIEQVQAEQVEAEILQPAPRATLLEAVPSEPKPPKPDEMDAALRSALETLHRMNVRTR
jgi:hypothetical protein